MGPDSATLRPFRTTDTEALVDVCVRTADAGGDARGLLPDDRLWARVYLLPYLERHPDLAFVVELDGAPVGYIVATPDTETFSEWFRTQWWPAQHQPAPEDVPAGPEQQLLSSGARGITAWAPEGCPAHLHIDLLPAAQGHGAGRALIERLCAELAARGVEGVHATASASNLGALAFYPRVGFEALPAVGGAQTFVRPLVTSTRATAGPAATAETDVTTEGPADAVHSARR